jgi:hypothetical protein
MKRFFHRLAHAIAAFRHAPEQPHYHFPDPTYAVIYDVPIIEDGKPTGDIEECFYEEFDTPAFAAEMFRTGYPADMDMPPENARLVMILGPIDQYAR